MQVLPARGGTGLVMRFGRARRANWTLLWAALAAHGLAGCAEQQNAQGKLAVAAPGYALQRPDVSPSGATVSVAVDGAPEAIAVRLTSAIAAAAAERDIVVTDEKSANYVVHASVSAYPVEEGVALAYVWDVFDSNRHRAQRINDAVIIKATGQERATQEPWTLADDNALAGIANRSADDLAAFLSTTPEARAAASTTAQVSRALTLGAGHSQTSLDRRSQAVPAETMGMAPAQ
jgi:hypothetical protein